MEFAEFAEWGTKIAMHGASSLEAVSFSSRGIYVSNTKIDDWN
jgi:hypothetical protein